MEEIEFFFNLEKEQNLEELEKISQVAEEKPKTYDPNTIFLRKFVTALFAVGEEKVKPKEAIKPEIIEKPRKKPKPLPKKLEIPKPVILKPLITPSPKFPEYPLVVTKDNKIIVKAHLLDNTYYLDEPNLSEIDLTAISRLKDELKDKLIKNPKLADDKKYLYDLIQKIYSKYNIKINDDYYERLRYYLVRDILGFGIIDSMLKDKNIREIYCDGVDKTIYLTYNDEKIETKIKYDSEKDIDMLINKFAALSNKRLDSEPFLDVMLPSGISISATRGLGVTASKYLIKK
ncbi:hypothetical protein COV14_04910 [Candidatus Woesearchaeota archaeon CG10_big_fil_rev_8_21_14_0_10_33_12]|nr:MAG: hypothetical protein COV14_04910 [Candidatus Woesearchaeota archaeon CG10_big_fil_rev_8_21_14_0_10_33_12]